MSTVIERAQQEAERRRGLRWTEPLWINPREAVPFVLGAEFAATITPEQVEAAARAIQSSERDAGNVAGIDWCRQRARAVLIAAGFEVTS